MMVREGVVVMRYGRRPWEGSEGVGRGVVVGLRWLVGLEWWCCLVDDAGVGAGFGGWVVGSVGVWVCFRTLLVG